MEGYYRVPRSETFDREGFFKTGDLGYLDGAGCLHFATRLKDVIKTAGVNVAAVEVEEALAKHPSVKAAHVVGVPTQSAARTSRRSSCSRTARSPIRTASSRSAGGRSRATRSRGTSSSSPTRRAAHRHRQDREAGAQEAGTGPARLSRQHRRVDMAASTRLSRRSFLKGAARRGRTDGRGRGGRTRAAPRRRGRRGRRIRGSRGGARADGRGRVGGGRRGQRPRRRPDAQRRPGRGKVIEVGGQWVGPGQDAIMGLAAEVGVETYKTYNTGNNLLYYKGVLAPYDAAAGCRPCRRPISSSWSRWRSDPRALARQIPLDHPWTRRASTRWGSTARRSRPGSSRT